MKNENAEIEAASTSKESLGESSKLASVLALATGAIAMPQTGQATVIYSNLSANPIVINPILSSTYTLSGLPANDRIRFTGHYHRAQTVFQQAFKYYETINIFRVGTASVKFQVSNGLAPIPFNAGQAWNTLSGVLYKVGGGMGVANATNSNKFPTGLANYNHKYFAMTFQDASLNSLYGWIEVSYSNTNISNPFTSGPRLTIYGYAYDTTGAQLSMGAGAIAPEPSSTAVLAVGALVLGARGVRSWRRSRSQTAKA